MSIVSIKSIRLNIVDWSIKSKIVWKASLMMKRILSNGYHLTLKNKLIIRVKLGNWKQLWLIWLNRQNRN
jgi:hypothetical protein